MNILNKIVATKKRDLEARKKKRPLRLFLADITLSQNSFKKSILEKKPYPHLIAEIKKASPSEGVLRKTLDADLRSIIKIYEKHAAAISVVTDERSFLGNFERMKMVRTLTSLPILCKDFIIDPYQIYEARYYGADAILLIASLFETETALSDFLHTAHVLSMDALVEVHTKADLKLALTSGASLLGINNRDLSTFKVTFDTTLFLLKNIPPSPTVVSESGFYTAEDIKKVAGKVHAVLVGGAFMKAQDINETMRALGY